MADAKISALPSVTSPTTSDQLAIVQSSTTSKITVSDFLGGITGSFTFYGDTASGGDLTLSSTAHATKGSVIVGSIELDEANTRLGIGTTPTQALHIVKSGTLNCFLSDSSQAADTKIYTIQIGSGHFSVAPVSDAGATGTNVMRIQRSTTTLTNWRFGNPSGTWVVDANASSGRVHLQVPESAPSDGSIQAGTYVMWHDTTGPSLKLKHKDSGGTVRTGTVAIS